MTISRWVKSEDVVSSVDGEVSTARPGGPLKPRLDAVQSKIESAVLRLDELQKGLRVKNEESVKSLLTAIKDNNAQSSTVISSDLTKARQVSRVIALSKITLEKLATRLGAVSDFGDLVVVLSPAVSVVKNLRTSLAPHIPDMEQDFGNIAELLSGILIDAGQVGGFTINFESANEEGSRIIEEAGILVEQQMREEFSGIPDIHTLAPTVSGMV